MFPCPRNPPDLSLVPPIYHDLGEVFSKCRALTLPPYRPYDCAIDLLPGAPLPEREAMEKYIKDSLSAGLMRPSSSTVGAGFFFVAKKDKSLRPCIDFRGLNNITVEPCPSSVLHSSCCRALQSSLLDLRNAYHLSRICEGDEWKTAFNTPHSHFEYLVMPFSLTNAPAMFQNLVNDVLRDFLNRSVFVYLDTILIFSRNQEEHFQHVRQVFQRLLENKLYVKAEKCEFSVTSVSFLGFIIESGQVRTCPEKVSAVTDWPIPDSCKKLQQFLGFANFYRRYIHDYSRVAARLTSPALPFAWTPEAEAAFFGLKILFSSAPILIQPFQAVHRGGRCV